MAAMSDAQFVPCPFVTYEHAKTPPTRKKYAELVKWRGETHLYLPKLFPLPEEDVAVSADSDRSREFTFTLVRLSDNKEFTSAPTHVGEDFPSAVWGDGDQSARFVVQFDDGKQFDESVGRPDYSERRRYRALRHVYFELDADTGVLTKVDETSENDGAEDQRFYGWADGVLRSGETSSWKHGTMKFEGDTVYFGAPREDTPLFQDFLEWIENPQPKFEGHDTETGWKRQEETAGWQQLQKDKYQYVCVLEFDKYQRGMIDEKKDYIMFEDENKIRVLDLEVMYEIVRVKETLRETGRFTLDEDKYSGARKTCFVANARRFFRDIFRKRIVDAEMRDLRESLQVWRGNTMAEFMQNERRNLLLYDIQQTFGDLFREDIDYVDDRIQELLAEDEEDEEDEESAGGDRKRRHLKLADPFPSLRF